MDLREWESVGYHLLNLSYKNFYGIDSNDLCLVLLCR